MNFSRRVTQVFRLKVTRVGSILFEIHHRFDRERFVEISIVGIISFPPGTFLSSVCNKVGEEGEITRSFVRGKDNFGHFRIQSVSERNRRNREDVGFHRVSERRSVREYKSGHPVHGGAPTHVSTRVYVCVYLPVSVHGSVIRGGSRAAE